MLCKVTLGVAALLIAISHSNSFSIDSSANNDSSIADNNVESTVTSPAHILSANASLSDFTSSSQTPVRVTLSNFSSEMTTMTTMGAEQGNPSHLLSVTNSFQNHSAITHSADDATMTTSSNEISSISAVSNETMTGVSADFVSTKLLLATTTAATASTDAFHVPEDCSAYKLLDDQPMLTASASIKKCCPPHQTFTYEHGKKACAPRNGSQFHVNAIYAKFFENCIEDMEIIFNLSLEIVNNCKSGLIYSANYNDSLYVIQNGSLLRVDSSFESYDIFEHYCLEMDEEEQVITAIVCEFDDLLLHVGRTQALIFATCMLISVPCLLLTASLYLVVPELRDLHGKSLACHSISMAIGFFLLALTQFRDMHAFEGYVIQFLVIACFMWLTVMWIDICVHAWHYLPKGIKQTPQGDNIHLLYYCLFAFGVPLLLVILTYLHKFGGLPSYYLKGTTKVTRTSQRFFIPPISASLIANVCLYVSSYFGFKKLQQIKITEFLTLKLKECARLAKCSKSRIAHMEKVETIMKSTAFLTTIMTINWIFEIISFYVDAPSTMFDIINALQGVFIFLMFVCTPRPIELIKRWWKDRGSFKVLDNNSQEDRRRRAHGHNDIQMTSLHKQGT